MNLAAGLALLAAAGAAAGTGLQESIPWVRVATPHFEVVAEVPAGDAATVARRLEAFRSLVEASLPAGSAAALQPTLAVVFATDRAFSSFTPTSSQGGQAARVAAFVGLDESAPGLSFPLERGDKALGVVLHEYARVLLRRMPLWFMEGAAEVYGTAAPTEDGRRLRVGGPVVLNVRLLREASMPLAELLGATRAPGGMPGQVFYAQSWALAHYLLLGDEERARRVPSFLARAAAGDPAVKAFEEAFGPLAEIERELRRYVEGGARGVREVELPAASEAVPLPPPEVEAALGRLLFQAGRAADAETRLRRALTGDPSLVEAHLSLGLLQLGQGRFTEALDRFAKAQELAPASLPTAFHLARAVLRSPVPVEDGRVEAARAALAKVLVPSVRAAGAWTVLGALSGRLGRLEEAERALRTALDLEPARLEAVAELADVLVAGERFDEAERLLDSARGLAERTGTDLGPWRERVATEREVARIRADLAEVASASAGEAPITRRTGRWLAPPVYRTTAPGEERTHGLLQRIDCGTGRVTVEVATAGGPIRLTATSLTHIQAISYRDGFEGLLACGPRREREPVFVTWRPSAAGGGPATVKGTIVALEFLGEEYLPR